MNSAERRPAVASWPRVVVAGSYRDGLGLPTDELPQALARQADVVRIAARAPVRQSWSVFRQASRAIRKDGYELVHLLDPRFAVIGMMLRHQFDVPVSISVSSVDVGRHSPFARLTTRALNHLDQGFTSEDAVVQIVRQAAPRLPVSLVPLAASPLPAPSTRGLASIARLLKGVRPDRLILALPWPENRNDLRWFRDVVVPQLDAHPVCLLLGVPSRREARLMVGAIGMHSDFRIHAGRLDADVIASAARRADAFVVCAASEAPPSVAAGRLAIALATGGVPVVTNASEDARVLAHERSAFVVEPSDERGYVHALNQILALPSVQRHFLGEEFARFTMARWSWLDVASAYTERFAALVGRPQIPTDLRAAA